MTPSFARLLLLNYVASGAIAPHRIVKATSTDGVVAQAAADTDPLFGVSTQVATATGERLEVERAGVVPVEYGGTIAAGAFLTSDASGRAITAAAGDRFIGIAEEAGDLGTIGTMFIQHGLIAPA